MITCHSRVIISSYFPRWNKNRLKINLKNSLKNALTLPWPLHYLSIVQNKRTPFFLDIKNCLKAFWKFWVLNLFLTYAQLRLYISIQVLIFRKLSWFVWAGVFDWSDVIKILQTSLLFDLFKHDIWDFYMTWWSRSTRLLKVRSWKLKKQW